VKFIRTFDPFGAVNGPFSEGMYGKFAAIKEMQTGGIIVAIV